MKGGVVVGLGIGVGSSPRALAELVLTAPLLGIPLKRKKLSDKQAQALAQEEREAHPCWRER